jgi:transcriptional regulator with XRE-family HTH domain
MRSLYPEWEKPENQLLVQGWKRDGLTEKQIAANMGIAEGTIYEWKRKYPRFSELFRIGKQQAIYDVENAALKGAKGFYYTEETQELKNGAMVVTKTVKKYVPPNPTLIMFWLKHADWSKWGDSMDASEIADMSAIRKSVYGDA